MKSQQLSLDPFFSTISLNICIDLDAVSAENGSSWSETSLYMSISLWALVYNFYLIENQLQIGTNFFYS